MRFFIGMIIAFGLTIWAFTQVTWDRTDVDVHFSNYYHHGAAHYDENCLKPKAFRGLFKFKVSCTDMFSFVDETKPSNEKIDEYFADYIPQIYARGWRWSIIEKRDLLTYDISVRGDDPPVYVLKRTQGEYPNCERLIFLTYSYKTGKVYFADPRKLYCKVE